MNIGNRLSNRVEHENRIKAQIIIFEELINTLNRLIIFLLESIYFKSQIDKDRFLRINKLQELRTRQELGKIASLVGRNLDQLGGFPFFLSSTIRQAEIPKGAQVLEKPPCRQ